VTVTVWPAIIAVPVRAVVPGLASIVTVTDPLPLPEAGPTAIHDAPLDAVQLQPAAAVTVTLAVPAAAGTESVAGESV